MVSHFKRESQNLLFFLHKGLAKPDGMCYHNRDISKSCDWAALYWFALFRESGMVESACVQYVGFLPGAAA